MVAGSVVGHLRVLDADEERTLNSQLSYNITAQLPDSSPRSFSIDAASGDIQAMRLLQRRDQKLYELTVRVSDPGEAGRLPPHPPLLPPPLEASDHRPSAPCPRFQHRLQGRHQGHRRQQRDPRV